MATVTSPVRRRILAGAFVASLAFALIAPGAAFAATASFSHRAPASGSHTNATRPTISAVVYDRYGIKGTGAWTLYVDGKTVKPKVTYLVSGSWNPSHPDYRRIRVTYVMGAALAPGVHRVTLRIHDLKHKTSTTSWSFTVDGPYKASFSSPSPTRDSTITASHPTLSLTTYDKYGVKGAGKVTMAIDGVLCVPTVRYTRTGVYTGFKVTYAVPDALGLGTHTVQVGVTDLKGKVSAYSWSFKVAAAPLLPMPITGSSCADCHSVYATSHPMTNCPACHRTSSPPRPNGEPMEVYTSGERSAHTTACATGTCHRGGGTFPHVIGTDCARCHTGTYPGIPGGHSTTASQIEGYHQSTSTFCVASGCHVASLTLEHYRRVVDGARLSCATCHQSADATVREAIASKSTACDSCHSFDLAPHPGTTTAHATTNTCARVGCHTTDVTTIHKGNCSACHANPDHGPSTNCDTCHAPGAFHLDKDASHAVPKGGCVGNLCHGTSAGGDAALFHKDRCDRCHTGSGTPVKTCATCHSTDLLSFHPDQAIAHTADAQSCTASDCHGTSVTTIHTNATGGPCAVCHNTTRDPSKVCADCHAGDLQTVHAASASKHSASTASCISSACHANADVTVIHSKTTGGPGCVCHEAGKTKTLVCSTSSCHPDELEVVHAKAGAKHTPANISCVATGCHKNDVTAIHKTAPLGCRSCHNGAALTITCATCHAGDPVAIHSSADTSHAVAPDMCVTGCHSRLVSEIHSDTPSGCTACHDGVKTLSTVCSDCHTGTTQERHASAGAFHSALPNGCVLAGCHEGDVTELHLATPGEGCPRCHSPGQTPTIACTACHGADLPTVHASAESSHAVTGNGCTGSVCHATNVAVIHNVVGVGCIVCHGPDGHLTTDCSTCHSTDVLVVHQKADAPHTVPAGGSCFTPKCHPSGNAAAIHQSNQRSCSVCHESTAPKTVECGICHVKAVVPDLHASADASHTALTGTCVAVGCHKSNVAVLHLNGPNCAVCHGAGAPTTLACSTGGCHSQNLATVHAAGAVPHVAHAGYCVTSGCHSGDLTTIHDANGTGPRCAACHDNPDHAASDVCTDCHPSTQALVHASSDTSHTVPQTACAGYSYSSGSPCHRTRVDTIHRTAPDGCLSCHGSGQPLTVVCATCHVGQNAPEHASAAGSHTAPGGLCVNGQCHGSSVTAIHAGSTKSCLACHDPLGNAPSVTCADCHADDPLTFHDHPAASHAIPQGTTCFAAGCHVGTDVSAIHGIAGGPGCTACHNTDRVATATCSAAAPCHGAVFSTTHASGDATHTLTQNGVDQRYGGCVHSGCHTGSAVDIHAAGATPPGCAACHANPSHAPSVTCGDCHLTDIRLVHAPYIGTGHDTATPACTSAGCHSSSASAIHSTAPPKWSPKPAPQCVPCHTTGPLTVDCMSCHTGTQAPPHASADTSHTVALGGACVKSGCHDTNVSKIHVKNGVLHCEACHTGGKPVLDCSTTGCHVGGFTSAHPAPAAKHSPATGWCVKSGCHSTNVATIHITQLTGGPTPPGCDACHANGKTLSMDCSIAGCHPGAVPNNHTAPSASHVSSDGCTTLCHASNVATLHATGTTPPGCIACHAYNKTHSLVCANCHSTGTYHAAATAKHVAPVIACTVSGCHSSGDVSLIHVKSGTQRCQACHAPGTTPATTCTLAAPCHGAGAGDHTSAHAECNGCHYDPGHWDWAAQNVGDGSTPCLSCHGNPGVVWRHPDLDCHGSCHGWLAGYSWTMAW
jgi:hypothetical protein